MPPNFTFIGAAIEATGRVAAWLSGHVHWNTITTIAGIRHITIQSMSERFTTMPEPAAAFAMLEISESELDLVPAVNRRGIRALTQSR